MLANARKDHSITLVCHAFKIDKNAIREAGVIRSEKYSAVPTYAAIRSKKIQLLAQLAQREKQRLPLASKKQRQCRDKGMPQMGT